MRWSGSCLQITDKTILSPGNTVAIIIPTGIDVRCTMKTHKMQRREFFRFNAALFTIPAAWAEEAAKPDWRPSVLDDDQNETVILLTDLIIPATDTPGTRAARVNRRIDLLLRDGDPEPREKFVDGLKWMDGLAIEQHALPFAHLTADQQVAMLTALNPRTGPGHEFFVQIKDLTARIYYNCGRVPVGFGGQHGHA